MPRSQSAHTGLFGSWHLSDWILASELAHQRNSEKNNFIVYEQYSEIWFYSDWGTHSLHVCTQPQISPQEQKSSLLAAETALQLAASDLDCLIAKYTIRKSFTGFVLLSRDIFSNQACNCVTVMSNSDGKLLYRQHFQSCLPKIQVLEVVLSLEILHFEIKSWHITRFDFSDWHPHLQIIFCSCLLTIKLKAYYMLYSLMINQKITVWRQMEYILCLILSWIPLLSH